LRVREANEGWAEFVGRLISNRYGGKQSALADAVGVSPSTVTRWLDGATPAIPQLRAISEETGFGMAELLTAAGALDGAAAATPSVSPDVVADVAEAIRRDTELIEEARAHLLNQYELLRRLSPPAVSVRRSSQTGRRASTPSGDDQPLRAVARGGDPSDRGQVRKLARQAREQYERDQKDTGKGR
jgi:transcriptional regulator with XRE-family HTH domain